MFMWYVQAMGSQHDRVYIRCLGDADIHKRSDTLHQKDAMQVDCKVEG